MEDSSGSSKGPGLADTCRDCSSGSRRSGSTDTLLTAPSEARHSSDSWLSCLSLLAWWHRLSRSIGSPCTAPRPSLCRAVHRCIAAAKSPMLTCRLRQVSCCRVAGRDSSSSISRQSWRGLTADLSIKAKLVTRGATRCRSCSLPARVAAVNGAPWLSKLKCCHRAGVL